MTGQDISVTKTRGRPRSEPTAVIRLPLSVLAQVDVWIAELPEPRPSRPEAIRHLLAKVLGKAEEGARESIATEDLNASNDEQSG
jgi:hypothetical protein